DHLIFDVQQREEQLEKLEIEKDALFEVVLHPFYRQWTQLRANLYGAPPVRLEDGSEITGTLGPLCEQGLLYFGEDNLEGWARSWPAFLTLQHLMPLKGTLLSLKKGKVMTCALKDPTDALHRYLHYFGMSKQLTSPVMPEWLTFFLKRDVEGLDKKLQQVEVTSPGNYIDPSWQWLLRRDPCPKAAVLIANWADAVEQTFGGYFEL
nr:hypothetical protein [Chlamydiota bacterium]